MTAQIGKPIVERGGIPADEIRINAGSDQLDDSTSASWAVRVDSQVHSQEMANFAIQSHRTELIGCNTGFAILGIGDASVIELTSSVARISCCQPW